MYEAVKGSIEPAIRLFHHRWSVPIVATLLRTGPLRFGELTRELPRASRDTLAETLRALVANGLIEPEGARPRRYALTARGRDVASECRTMVEVAVAANIVPVALKKWTMTALVAIGRGNQRHRDILAALPGITPRALTSALRDLAAAGLIERVVTEEWPPGSIYRLTSGGEDVFPAVERLVLACERALSRAE